MTSQATAIKTLKANLKEGIRIKQADAVILKQIIGFEPFEYIYGEQIDNLPWNKKTGIVEDKTCYWHNYTRERVVGKTKACTIIHYYIYRGSMIGFSFMHYDDVWDKKIRIFDLECREMTELELYEAAASIDKNRN